jgi:hypothetical protein
MKKLKIENTKCKYFGKECISTTIYLTDNDEGKRIVVRKFKDSIQDDVKIIEGYGGQYEDKIPFKEFFKMNINNEEGFEFNDVWITDPTKSECGRFEVDPKEYYGIDK